MILRLALRSLTTRPLRTAVLAIGFGLGIGVMVELLGVGEVILEQAHAPVLQGLWVRVSFHDNEMIEGIVGNTSDYVLQDGFFLMPTDPNGNNKLVYVLKGGLKDFHVLGLRNPSKSLHKV